MSDRELLRICAGMSLAEVLLYWQSFGELPPGRSVAELQFAIISQENQKQIRKLAQAIKCADRAKEIDRLSNQAAAFIRERREQERRRNQRRKAWTASA